MTIEDGLTYAAAAAELDAILGALERETVDVDDLEARVRRATELIAFCRERLSRTQLQVERIVSEIGTEARPDQAG